MRLVIDIPEEDYIRLRDEGMFGNVTTFKRAVREGTPLPKGHGRLIDADSIKDKLEDEKAKLDCLDIDYGLKRACLGKLIYEVQSSQTIIEADKAESEG